MSIPEEGIHPDYLFIRIIAQFEAKSMDRKSISSKVALCDLFESKERPAPSIETAHYVNFNPFNDLCYVHTMQNN